MLHGKSWGEVEGRKDGREGQGRGRREGRGPTSKVRGREKNLFAKYCLFHSCICFYFFSFIAA